ncbi:MAG TPA: amidohydrolase family protein [Rhizomicrobium sp.]|jgi:imidazolonepropionase-like amidohydrolase|nr:amidohydrolase family protein [Rhizomicrobium sp.]
MSVHSTILQPDRVWSNGEIHTSVSVLIRGNRIEQIASAITAPDAEVIPLPSCTLLPGLMDLHSHLFLHPYNETAWDDQVLKESEAYRTVRAVRHAEATVRAGFTTLRDLGTEGVGYADVALKKAIDEDLTPGPRLFVASRAIVATGGYAPMRKNYRDDCCLAAGAEEASGVDEVVKAVRHQAAHGADWIKFYADYRVGPNGETVPTFSIDELRAGVDTAHSLGRPVAAHATGNEGMLRAVLAGVDTIEHGYGGAPSTFALMKQKGIAYLPTLMAAKWISIYRGEHTPGGPASPAMALAARAFQFAREAGVVIGCGSDVGVFAHGANAGEMLDMHGLGMSPNEVLRAATAINAAILRRTHDLGQIAEGYLADCIAVSGNPAEDVAMLQNIRFVMKNGAVIAR